MEAAKIAATGKAISAGSHDEAKKLETARETGRK